MLFAALSAISVSIHAPVKVRTNIKPLFIILACFNPRTREGANITSGSVVFGWLSFNPRTREGANACLVDTVKHFVLFQSTHP